MSNRARNGARGFAPSLGAKDPRIRTQAQGRTDDKDFDGTTLELKNGRARIKAADDIREPEATIESVHQTLCDLLQALKGG